jgi:SAM-dependent methyltransferase
MRGLDELPDFVEGRTVLDVGCAEGLVAFRCAEFGAKHVNGIDVITEHIRIANAEAERRGVSRVCKFELCDASEFSGMRGHYDVTLMLAVLHKLWDPSRVAAKMAALTRKLAVIRLPASKDVPMIVDRRSGYVPHDIGAVMRRSGFSLSRVTRGSFNEWTGWYKRP